MGAIGVPRFVCQVNGTFCEAIRFIKDDPTTHWHVNLGHPVAVDLKDKFWVQTDDGPALIDDGDWVVFTNRRFIMNDAAFRSAYNPVTD